VVDDDLKVHPVVLHDALDRLEVDLYAEVGGGVEQVSSRKKRKAEGKEGNREGRERGDEPKCC
jgi:hypothetical protein